MNAIIKEPHILRLLIKFNFILKIIASFQDYDNLYIVTNFFEGYSLNSLRNNNMSEEQIKFISACIIQSLTYLRKREIINRDIRMKNLIMDNKSYFNLIDYSYAIKYSEKNISNTNIITNKKEISPEILNHSLYDYNVDYFNFGVIIYYLIFKKFVNVIKKETNLTQIYINPTSIKNYSSSCIDFVNKLLISDYKKRIGFKSINELKNHLWFKGFNWKNLKLRKMKSPFNFTENKSIRRKCRKFRITKKKRLIFRKIIRHNYYKILIRNYDFINKIIILKIFRSIKHLSY